jgi:hypothetical protein
MLSDIIFQHLFDLDKYSMYELMSIVQKITKDTFVNVPQARFGSYIANHVLEEKIDRYNRETIIPPKFGDLWIPNIQITIEKLTWHAILNFGSTAYVILNNYMIN